MRIGMCSSYISLGQSKSVYIYKLSIAGTVEERILALQVRGLNKISPQAKKRGLAKSVLDGEMYVLIMLTKDKGNVCTRWLTQTFSNLLRRSCDSCFLVRLNRLFFFGS